jgi:methylase of polypeptide subunit release factors
MNTVEIKNKFDVLLKKLSAERSFDVAEKITAELVELLNIKTKERFLVNMPRVDAELTRFQLAPGFARQAAAYELPHEDNKPIDLKLFWVKKTSKTNLSWLIGLTPNFEDTLSNDYKNIGIDFVVPESCDSITVLLSNRFKVRALELKDHITQTQLEIFTQWVKLSELEVADQSELKDTLHAKLWESFNFEPVNLKFYKELVEHFNILVHHLEKKLERKMAVMFTTRLIGRLLFVWFLKKKNLVNGDIKYFSIPELDKQNEYYKNKLEKLFFEVLNKEITDRDNGDKFTPYLNGGLFDKNTTDFFNDPNLSFPNGYFNQLFITLNKYNFTVDESSPEFQHVAIDPEMLGRIFESLLAEQIDEDTGNSKKKITGAVYTSREIVSYMCEQSLIEYLKTTVPDAPDRDRRIDELVRMPEAIFRDQDQNKRRDWKPYRESIIKALEGSKSESPLTVLDPAVGSGSFPMGMLHLLVKVYSRLDPKFEKDISGLKRDILSRSIYGVDIEQTAVEICRLRAWLSIIVDIPENEKVEPLPNLEFKFVCANALIPLDNTEQATFITDHDLKNKMIAIRNEYFKTSSKVKKEKLQKDYLKLTQGASLFDNKKTQQLKSYRPFDVSSSSEFYDPELMHGVQAFDIVIGNPPYVSINQLARSKDPLITYLKSKHVSLGNFYGVNLHSVPGNSKKYPPKPNMYAFFFVVSSFFAKKLGHIAFIVPKGVLTAKDLDVVRYFFLDKLRINQIVAFKKRVFLHNGTTSASVPTSSLVILLKNNKEQKDYNINATSINLEDINNFQFTQIKSSVLTKKLNNWNVILSDEECNKLIDKYENNNSTNIYYEHSNMNKPSQHNFYFDVGFILDNKKILSEINITEKSKYYDLFDASGFNNYILETKKYYPKEQSNIQLTKNSQGYIVLDQKYKILWSVKNPKIFVFSDEDIIFPMGKAALIASNDKNEIFYLLGLLNSKLSWFIFNTYFKNEGEKDFLLPISALKSFFKVPRLEKDDKNKRRLIEIISQLITLKKSSKDADVKNLESQIDQFVYKLYDLTPKEIEIVENSSK